MGKLLSLVTGRNIRPWRRVYGAIGVDVSLSYLHLVQLARDADGSLHIVGRASVAHPCDRAQLLASSRLLSKQIAKALKLGRFRGRRAVLAMPASEFRTISINYRTPQDVSDDRVILSLMKERLDEPLENYVIDYIPVRAQARDAEKLAIVAVSSRDSVVKFLNTMRQTGLEIDALEIGPIAICRLVAALPDSKTQMTLVITSGQDKSYLTLLSGRRLLMDQAIEFSESRLLDTISKALDMSPESARQMVFRTGLHPQASTQVSGHQHGETGVFNTLLEILKPEILRLVEEIDRVFMYAAAQARGGGEARICLLGSLARWPGFDQVISRFTHLQLSTLANPLRLFSDAGQEPEEDRRTSEPEFAVAAGLALRGLMADA